MKLRQIGPNQTEVILSPDKVVFFSYETPVAAIIDGKFYRTSKRFSVTTSKHINRWLDGRKAEEKPQSFFDSLVS